jgi:hypothetical protein
MESRILLMGVLYTHQLGTVKIKIRRTALFLTRKNVVLGNVQLTFELMYMHD